MPTPALAPALLNLGATGTPSPTVSSPPRDAAPGAFAREMAQAQSSSPRPPSITLSPASPPAASPAPPPSATAGRPAAAQATASKAPEGPAADPAQAGPATARNDRSASQGHGEDRPPDGVQARSPTAPQHRLARGRLAAARSGAERPGTDGAQTAPDAGSADRPAGRRVQGNQPDDQTLPAAGGPASLQPPPLPAAPPAPAGPTAAAGPDPTTPATVGTGPGTAGASDALRGLPLSMTGAAEGAAQRGTEALPADAAQVQALALPTPPLAASPAAQAATDPGAALAGASPVTAASSSGGLPASLAALLEQRPPAESPPSASAGLPGFAAELARASQQLPAALPASGPAPTELTLPTPVNAPDFLPRLSGELAVLARDGVQEARVNLHPVELGPIAVQIALDGSTAQVHLSVDNARTRELLEQAMPMLAASLRDSGLTLTGGGVFQQPRQAPQDRPGTDSGSPGRGIGKVIADGPAALGATAPARPLRRVGGLDVFA